MENKQTAVEWLLDKIAYKNDLGYWCIGLIGDTMIQDHVDQAKEMERKQIEEAYNQDLYGGLSGDRKYENGSDYFTKNYQNGK